jgi:hypothetical protein
VRAPKSGELRIESMDGEQQPPELRFSAPPWAVLPVRTKSCCCWLLLIVTSAAAWGKKAPAVLSADQAIRLRNSLPLEIGLLILTYPVGYWVWRTNIALGTATWYAAPEGSQSPVSVTSRMRSDAGDGRWESALPECLRNGRGSIRKPPPRLPSSRVRAQASPLQSGN